MCNAAVYTVCSRLLESDYLGKAKTGGLVYVSLLQGVNVGWKAYENAFKLGSDKTLLRVSEGKLLETSWQLFCVPNGQGHTLQFHTSFKSVPRA